MHRRFVVCVPLFLAACNLGPHYSPSLTQVRTGEVVVDDPPEIPADEWVPGVNVAPEDYEPYADVPAPFLLDTTYLKDLDDPTALAEHAAYAYEAKPGAIFDETAEGHLEYDDVEQGALGDCYFVAALSATLYTDVDNTVRKGLIRAVEDQDDHATFFVVRFYDAWGKPQDVEIDADLVRSGSGKPTYARSLDSTAGHEEWAISLVEKAYAQWHGGYKQIGDGGYAGDVMQALTGSSASYRNIASVSDTTLYRSIDENLKAHKPVVSCTFGEDSGVDYEGSGVHAWHCYSTLAVRTAGTDKFIQLRNPWGESEPANNGADDGIFELSFRDYRRLYETLHLGGGTHADHTAPGKVDDLAVAEGADGKLVITFTATGDDDDDGLAYGYDVRVSTSPIDAQSFWRATEVKTADPASPGTAERMDIGGLAEGSTYYVAVMVADEAGNLSALSNVVNATSGGTTPDPDPQPGGDGAIFDFESGTSDWAVSGLWHTTDSEAASGHTSFWFGQESTLSYATGDTVTGMLTSPTVAVPAGSPSLMWEQILDVEADASYDKASVLVATEHGAYSDWREVWSKSGTSSSFATAEVSLADYAGQNVRIRFAFDSVDGQSNDSLGWFVDDVWVAAQ